MLRMRLARTAGGWPTGAIEKGGILVGVYAHNDRVEVARDALNAAGADKVTQR